MIQIYKAENRAYDMNGDCVLSPSSCVVEAELNGTWKLTLTHPVDLEKRYEFIQAGAVISAPTFMPDMQLFRIYDVKKTDIMVTSYARPIFLDAANEVFIVDTRPTNMTGQRALTELTKGTIYHAHSDITGTATAYYIRKNLIEAIQSEDDQSFLNRWGGEILYDNYDIYVNKRVGGDFGARAEMGYNSTGMEIDVDMSDVVTRIIPVSYNGYTLAGNSPWVDSPLISKYPIVYAKEIKFEDVKLEIDVQGDEKGFETIEQLRAELVKRCKEQFELGIDLPKCNYKCDLVMLSQTEEYADVAELEEISIGDTVRCKNKELGIETEARAIKVTWDCIGDRYNKVELGEFKYNYFSAMSSVVNRVEKTIRPDGTIIGEEVKGIIDGAMAQLRLQNTVAKKTDERAFLTEDLDPESPLFGAMCYGTQGFQIANKRTPDGKDWDWSTFGTPEGFIATYLIAGYLLSRNYSPGKSGFKFSLDDGTIDSKHLKLDAAGLLTIYKALITGGEITIQNTAGETIFRVTEEGFWFGEDGGSIRYNVKDKVIEFLKNIKLTGLITNYSSSGKKSVVLGNNKIEIYSWQDDGNYVGSIGALASRDDPDSRQSLGIYSDKEDRIILGHRESNGTVKALITLDSTRVRTPTNTGIWGAIKLSEIPEIPDTFTGEYYIGTTKQYFCNGILYKRELGETYTGTLESGAGENIEIFNGVIKNVG